MSGNESLRIDAEHPWPWLDAFPESAQAFFNGREAATAQLLRCVLAAPATVLFGKSGLGKTSLLQAGLFPLLRAPERRLLPVLVRLDHGVDRPGLSAQLLARLRAETQAHQIAWEHPALPDEDSLGDTARLWELLHDSRTLWRDAEGRRWTPVFVLDQFEEVFTLVAEVEAQQRLFDELGNLVQGRIPAEVAARLDAHDELLDRIDPERLGARFVLSLREDYLPDLEIHADRIPRLGPNRYRLLPMSHAEAMEAIDKTGGALVDEADAERIVRFLDQQNLSVDPNRPRPQRRERIEPALLSLVCAGLNQHRVEQRAPKLDARSLDRLGGQLLEKFYDDALAALPEKRREAAARFIETELITLDGTRRPFPEQSLGRVGLDGEDIARLKDRRLLRTENTEHGAYVELVHDRIATVVAGRAQKSREREAARKEREKRALWWRIVAGIVAVLCTGLITTGYQWLQAEQSREQLAKATTSLESINEKLGSKLIELKAALGRAASAEADAQEKAELAERRASEAKAEAERALKAERLAKAAQTDAEAQKGKALAAARDATAQRVLSDANDYFGGINRPATGLQSLLMTLAGHRLAQKSAQPFVQAAGYAGLQREFNRSVDLIWVRETDFSIMAMALSPDGSLIVSGSRFDLRLRDVRSGHPIGEPLKGHSHLVSSVAFSPDGSRIVSGSWDTTLRLWDARSGHSIGQPLKGHSDSVNAVVFSPDGSLIASGSEDGTLRLWDARSGQAVGEPLKGSHGPVNSVAFSPDGSLIASGGWGGTIYLWNARSRQPISEPLKGILGSVSSIAFSPNGSSIVASGGDYAVHQWDIGTQRRAGKPLRGHGGPISSLAFHPTGQALVSGGWDGTLRQWFLPSERALGDALKGHSGQVTHVTVSPDGSRILSGGFDETLRLWKFNPSRIHDSMPATIGYSDSAAVLASNSDGSRIVYLGEDGAMLLWDGRSGRFIGAPLKGHPVNMAGVRFSPDGSRIVSTGDDKTLRIWDAKSGQAIGKPHKFESSIASTYAFSADSSRIVFPSSEDTLQILDIRSGLAIAQPILGVGGTISSVAFSPDGSRIVSSSNDGRIRQWDTRSSQPIGEPLRNESGTQFSVSFNQDGSRILSSDLTGTYRLWDARSGLPIGKPMKTKSGHVLGINRATAFSEDGSRIAFTSPGGHLHLWDARSGLPVGLPIETGLASIDSLAFSQDGLSIAIRDKATPQGTLPILDGWATELCTKLPRNMTRKEWREWISPDIDYVVQCPGLPVPAD